MAASPLTQSGEVLRGWQSPCFQATAGPVMLAGIPQRLAFLLAIPSILVGMLWPKILLITGSLYLIALIGTKWEPYWFSIVWQYVRYSTHYEG